MDKITLIIGGARSGKSTYAVRLAKESGLKTAFVATGIPFDGEMKKRIRLHKAKRPKTWQTFEDIEDLPALLKKIGRGFEIIIIDCLTLFVSNCLMKGLGPKKIESKVKAMMKILKAGEANAIIVSNEVGLGIVPDNPLARDFRDIAGRANQIVAKESNEVFFMIAGLITKIKGSKNG